MFSPSPWTPAGLAFLIALMRLVALYRLIWRLVIAVDLCAQRGFGHQGQQASWRAISTSVTGRHCADRGAVPGPGALVDARHTAAGLFAGRLPFCRSKLIGSYTPAWGGAAYAH